MKIHVLTLGCPKNIVDSEYLMGGLKHQEVDFVDAPQKADVIIINTCSFLLSAREEAVETILEAIQFKKYGKAKKIYVTGCLPQKFRKELEQELPEVNSFYDQLDFRLIADKIAADLKLNDRIPKIRQSVIPGHYAYLKIAEGCNNRCSYCLIPSIKGNFESREFASLVEEANFLVDQGVRELIITAQDTTYYGRDLEGDTNLLELMLEFSHIDDLKWIRLLYAHPAHLEDSIIDLMSEEEKICKYIDLPIQHISDTVLELMGRKVKRAKITKLIQKLRKKIDNLAIRSTVIVGFPGETENDFEELLDFIKEIEFERLGVFKYSREEGTNAFRFQDQISEQEKENRYQAIMETQQEISWRRNSKLVGKELEVIIDDFNKEENCFKGRTEWDSPEIDNQISIKDKVAIGNFYNVKITEAYDYDLIASINSTA
ncbi:30S ribosomal protein S12 methylthiotransferase RimO [candidate division KSB1 bacterium]|nr:30S ribosomal protein S12 methylthiotransferase RimO [candidate division KSB1 bacterium]